MTYLYDCGNEVISVWRSNNEFSTKVTVQTNDNGQYRDFDRTIREDKGGKFFTWNQHKIYLDNFKKTSIQDVKDKLERGEWITSDELCQAIMSEGVENVRFIIPVYEVVSRDPFGLGIISCSPNRHIDKKCHIVEEFNRNVRDNYKFKLYVDEYDGHTCRYTDMYVTDLVSELRSGFARIA